MALTPVELVTRTPSGMPMATPRSIPDELKNIQRSLRALLPQRLAIGRRADPVAGDQDLGVADLAREFLGRGDDRPLQLRKILGELHDRVVGPNG